MAKSDSVTEGGSGREKARLKSILATAVLVMIVGSCCLCSGAVWRKQPTFQTDPVAAVTLRREILPVQVPAVFAPEGAIEWDLWMLVRMQGAYYTLTTGDGELSFLAVDSSLINNADFRDHITQSLREHGAGGGFDLAVKSNTTKTYDVNGQSAEFQFLEAEDRTTGRARRLVDGIVDGPLGPVMISLWVDEDSWDPQMVDEMIASIGSEQPAESPTE